MVRRRAGGRPVTRAEQMIERQRAAADPAGSFWVSASAGAGKTHVLTDRVVRLMLAGTAPEKILCLTFTKAAAAEMANRVHERLGEWVTFDDETLSKRLEDLTGSAVDAPLLRRARRLFARVLDTPGGLKIQTIHSFCEKLLARFPLEAGLPAHFQVMDERTAEELMRDARERVFEADLARPLPVMERLAAYAGEDQFDELMRLLAQERGRLRRWLRGEAETSAVRDALCRQLGLNAGEDEVQILAAAAVETAFARDDLKRALALMGAPDAGAGANSRATIIAQWLQEDAAGRAATFADYCRAHLTGSDTPYKSRLNKKALEAAPDVDAILEQEAKRVEAVWDRVKAARIADASEALLQLGGDLLAAYEDVKRRHAMLDYDDLILSAHDLIADPALAPWVLYKLDGGIDHILIDEAQDTNPEQWRIAAALAEEFFAGAGAREEERTIFAVGDVKQSIYSFQRADPDAFARMRDHFAARIGAVQKPFASIELALSFRSTPAVLRAVDAIFSQPQARDGVALDADQIAHVAYRSGEPGRVEFWPVVEAEEPARPEPWTPPLDQAGEHNPVQQLAERIAARIRGWIERRERLAPSGPPIHAGDVMILVQRRAPFVEQMVRALKMAGVPVAGVDRMVLSEQLAVMDLIALARFVLLPEDDLNLAVVLKGPLIDLSEEKLFELAYERPANLWQSLRGRAQEEAEWHAVSARLQGFLATADQDTPFAYFADLLGPGGGRQRIVARLGLQANDPIDEFLNLALEYERLHPPSLQGFLGWLAARDVEVKRDQEQAGDAVRIMTVHAAKGLQAPIVILPDTVRTPHRSPNLFWPEAGSDGGDAPLWLPVKDMAPTSLSARREAAIRRRDQEYRRLFYVAMTRAADQLILCGWQTRQKRADNCWYELARSALEPLATPAQDSDGAAILVLEDPPGDGAAPKQLAPVVATEWPLPDWALKEAPPEAAPPRPLAPSRPSRAEPAVIRPFVGDNTRRFRRGNAIHKLLQYLPDVAAAKRRGQAVRYLSSPALGFAAEEAGQIVAETLAVVENPDFAHLFGPGSRAEVAISGVVGDEVISGQIDRLFIGESEIWLVDYKSQRPVPQTADGIAAMYLRQMACYKAVTALIYPEKSISCTLLWTDGPALMVVPERLLEAHAP